ncbi:MAG: histidinol-phosphatase HisJ family protein, partial [Bacillota bacterium]
MSKFSKADFHVHSSFSPDSMTHMFEMCEAAIARGLTSVCFTEHVEFDPADFGYGFFDYDRYRAGIQEARARYGHILRIGMGAEVSFTSKKVDEIRDFLANHEFDFVLGSLHMIDELFIGGDEYFEGRTEEEVYAPYWAELAAMASSGLFKRIGHLDYLKQA